MRLAAARVVLTGAFLLWAIDPSNRPSAARVLDAGALREAIGSAPGPDANAYAIVMGVFNADAFLPEEYDRGEVARAMIQWADADLLDWRLGITTPREDD